MAEVYIIEAVRTPIGVGKPEVGALHSIAPMDLAALVLRDLLRRAGVSAEQVEVSMPTRSCLRAR